MSSISFAILRFPTREEKLSLYPKCNLNAFSFTLLFDTSLGIAKNIA